jgi:lipopolysaccharide/colanic/teichoic acid biosynthesis glycosyltransferase
MRKLSIHHKHGVDQGAGGAAQASVYVAAEGMLAPVEFPAARTTVSPGSSAPDESLATSLPGTLYHVYRRTLDISASVVGLVFFAALLPILAVLIRLDSRGPVFYRQSRVGINRRRRGEGGVTNRRKVSQPGRPFEIIKLRTMTVNAEANGPQWASRNDSRITRVGHFLRKTRLDELPQFWNVLRGDMSLIGPRPERLVFVRQFAAEVPHYYDRLLVKPGLTGLAQVRNGYDTDALSVHRKVYYDREAIRRAGLLMDLKILLATVSVVIKGDGAH